MNEYASTLILEEIERTLDERVTSGLPAVTTILRTRALVNRTLPYENIASSEEWWAERCGCDPA